MVPRHYSHSNFTRDTSATNHYKIENKFPKFSSKSPTDQWVSVNIKLIVDNCLDFLALTETWCNENSTVSLGQRTPPGYSVIHTHRPTRGGVALIFRDTYKAKRVKTEKYTNFDKSAVKRRSTLGGLDQYTTPNTKLNTLELSAPPPKKKKKKKKRNKTTLHHCDVM